MTQPASPPPPAADVPVRAVVLFSSGVGYFEHAGAVAGDARTELRFKTQQINDVLKSLVLSDSGGRVGNVIYPSQDPVDKALKSFQVDVTGNPSLPALLTQLRGARVAVQLAAERFEGTVLGTEQRRRATPEGKGVIDAWMLNVLTGAAIRSVAFDDLQRLDLREPQLQEELNRALATLAGARDQDKKPVTIHFSGEGQREVRIGYVVEAPVWKTSYRLILPPSEAGKEEAESRRPRIQGWAIVENQTDNDWDDVELTLVSGRPISFVQELYQPLYVPRPRVVPELYGSLMPQRYEEGMVMESVAPAAAPAAPGTSMRRARSHRHAEEAKGAYAIGAGVAASVVAERSLDKSLDFDAAGVSAAAGSSGQIGELFQYTVPGVSLPRQQSAMIPIVVDDIEAERVSIYNELTLEKHPLYGLRLKNTTGKHLLQGPVTVLEEGSYAGDAQINHVPPDQQRLLSYGIDLQVLVNAKYDKAHVLIEGASIVKGVLRLKRRHVYGQTYTARNKGPRDKTLVIEHPVRPGAKLFETPQPVETTSDVHRFEVKLPAGQTVAFPVKQHQTERQDVQLLSADTTGPVWAYAAQAELPPAVSQAMTEALRRKQSLADLERRIEERRQQVKEITQEQGRIRDNLKTAPDKSPYQSRLLAKLDEQETRIESTQSEIVTLTATRDEQRQALEAHLAGLDVG